MTDIVLPEQLPAAPLLPQLAEWIEQHGEEAAWRMFEAHQAAEELADRLTPPNTESTYAKAWRVWQRFCTARGLPQLAGSFGTLSMFALWMAEQGKRDGTGMAGSSMETVFAGTCAELRKRGCALSRDDVANARKNMMGIIKAFTARGEQRGRGQAPAADMDGVRLVCAACPDTPTGYRDKSLILMGLHIFARSSEAAKLFSGQIRRVPKGLKPFIATAKTADSVRDPAIPFHPEPEICPVRAWDVWRDAVGRSDPADPAFHAIDRHGNIGLGMTSDSVTRAISRVSKAAGVPLVWTGHSLRAGGASIARANGATLEQIAERGGWAKNSRSLFRYLREVDEWANNLSASMS